MTHSFETFMSDVRNDGDTRVAELHKAWHDQHPGEPYPASNGVGEQVGAREQMLQGDKKGDKPSETDLTRTGGLEAKRAAQILALHTKEEASSRPDGFPPEAMMAWGVPDKSETPASGAASVQESNNTSAA